MRPRARRPFDVIIAAALLVAGAPARCEPESPGTHTIPFIVQHGKVIISVRVGGSHELKVLLDTGMPFEGLFLYKRELKDQLGVEEWTETGVAGAGSGASARAVQAEPVTFTAGDAMFTDQRLVVLQNDSFANFPRDGVIGYSLFGRHAVMIDHDAMKITLHEPGLEPGDGWHRIPLTFKDNKIPWVDTAVSLDGEATVPLSAYVDLASRETIELLIFDGMKFDVPEGLETDYLGRGLSGDVHGFRGTIARLELGGFTLRDVPAAFVEARVRSKQPGADAVLGNAALMRFNQIFDYSTGSLYLKPAPGFGESLD